MSVALVFPGQGSQRAGMLAAAERNRTAAAVFDEAADVLGYDPRAHDDARSLSSTVHAQMGLFLCGVASARMLAEAGVQPQIVAGHSVGAFAAAVCAGSVAFADALRLVRIRAGAMESLFPAGYGMGVCVGVAEPQVRALVEGARVGGAQVYVANVNAYAQVVVSGELVAVDGVLAAAKAHGARRAERLAVAVPSHSPLLEPVARTLHDAFESVAVAAPSCTYVAGIDGRRASSADAVARDLYDGVANEVRWDATARLIVELGTTLAIEALPGRTLTDLFENDAPIRAVALDEAKNESVATLARRDRSVE